MGLFGFGKDDAKDAKEQIAQTKSALEQAKEAPEDRGFVGNSAAKLVENLLDTGIDGKGPFDSASKIAADALKKAGGNVDEAVDKVVSSHLKLAAAGGFVTSVGGFITLPVALPANVLGFYLIATRMTAAIAQLRGHDLKQPQIRTAVLLTLVGADADDLLAKAGMVAPTGRITNLAAQRLPGPALMVVNKAVGFRLLSTAGKKTFSRFGRNVPLVGGVVGAGLDGWLLKRIGENARREFSAAPTQITQG
ncbi:EcsC family protein [Knoellia remsis]|uniref:EcsC family protein n=1 Tax=Knoellia remsis TaxID=407159 RepID=A0A2T0UDW8_9MICO|nr:EcsC family protein [Knoellia remsis]PRY56092.1 EcsC family protein [Knoellia remsis]